MCKHVCKYVCKHVCISALGAEIANWFELTNEQMNKQTWVVSWVATQLKMKVWKEGVYPISKLLGISFGIIEIKLWVKKGTFAFSNMSPGLLNKPLEFAQYLRVRVIYNLFSRRVHVIDTMQVNMNVDIRGCSLYSVIHQNKSNIMCWKEHCQLLQIFCGLIYVLFESSHL